MAVMMLRQNWTDERLDHFEKRVDERFDRIDERLERIETNIGEMHGVMLGTQRVMLQGFIAICTAMVGGFAVLAGVVG